MKRPLESVIQQESVSQYLTSLPTEILQRVFGFLKYKLDFLTVCQAWRAIGNFDNWRSLINSSNVAYLTKDARIRIYRLLLAETKENDVEDFDDMLAHDPDLEKHMSEITELIHMPLSRIVSDENILKVLRKYQINVDDIAISNDINRQALDESPDYISTRGQYVTPLQVSAQQQHLSRLYDILLRNNQQQLDTFLADLQIQSHITDNFSNMGFLLDTYLIPRYCSADTVKKLVPLFRHLSVCGVIEPQHLIDTVKGGSVYKLIDCLLFTILFGPMQRLDVAHELLEYSTYVCEHRTDACFFMEVIRKQDVKLLEFLLKYPLNIKNSFLNYSNTVTIYCNKLDGSMKDECEFKTASDRDKYQAHTVSPLMYSVCRQKSPQFIKKLIDLGADTFEMNKQNPWLGRILGLAVRLGNKEIITVLRDAQQDNAAKLAQQWQ